MKTYADRSRGWARDARARSRDGGRFAAAVVVLALLATGCAGGAAPTPILGGEQRAGAPSVQQTVHDGVRLIVTVSPGRPGPNLVRVDTTPLQGAGGHAHHSGADAHQDQPPVSVGADEQRLVPARHRPGTSGRWAQVRLPASQSNLLVSHGPRHPIPFPVDAGQDTGTTGGRGHSITGPDGPECLHATVGRLLAGGPALARSCPADLLEQRDARALRGVVAALGKRGAGEVTVLGDASARSRGAERVVRDAAAEQGLRVLGDGRPPRHAAGALVAVSGWQTTAPYLAAASRRQQHQAKFTGGIWLAPWLLSPDVVDSTSGAVLPLDFDVRDPGALAYAAALEKALPDSAPTQAGYRGWLSGRGIRSDDTVRLYAASRVAYMPVQPGHGPHETTVGWFPGGTVTPASGPLPVS